MVFRKLLTKKLASAAEVVVEPAKKAVQEQIDAAKKAVGDRSDWGAKIFKFILAGALVIFTFREERDNNPPNQPRLNAPPPNIVINNYIKEVPHSYDYKYKRNPANRAADYRKHN